jgi:arylsulfatase A-like enzyme
MIYATDNSSTAQAAGGGDDEAMSATRTAHRVSFVMKHAGKLGSRGVWVFLATWAVAIWGGVSFGPATVGPAATANAEALPSPANPNFVFILVDDLGWADPSSYGSRFYDTPHIDRLSQEGMTFTNAYAAASVCSPTRAAILTGKYPARLRITDWIPGQGNRPTRKFLQVKDRSQLPLKEVTIAERLQEAGYTTAHMGKWHLGGAPDHLPTDQGFDVNVGGYEAGSPGRFGGYFAPWKNPYLEAAPKETYLTDRLGREAARFIRRHQDRPFFLYLSFYAVHTPLEGKEELVKTYEARADTLALTERTLYGNEQGNRARIVQSHPVYAAMMETMDRNVGRVLHALEEAGVGDSTIVILTSDNGGLSVLAGNRQAPTANRPLRAGKGWLYEGGLRVPLVVKWPGRVAPGSTSGEPVSSIDFFPTMLDMAGLDAPTGPALDGTSLMPLFEPSGKLQREALYWHYPHYHGSGSVPSGAIRQGDYKLIEYFEEGRVELYNLAKDLTETHDLSDQRPEKAEALRERLESWRRSVGAQMPEPNPNYTDQ